MSSYFDTMSACLNDPKRFAEFVRNQYRTYLSDCNQNCTVKDLDRLNDFLREFDNTKWLEMTPEWTIEEMHEFAHRLGSAQIKLRGGRFVADNPSLLY